ncbi:metal ABC transporter permease [Paenibacillus spiritus]|uniref:Metal ABC transporter permease n=1 Tax=Paenibacillus spiritus TaxID=2496557 RepID=A0A5J5GH85_9BACL|nr:metal ABC transporter permease [Paenibacillus spiritus]
MLDILTSDFFRRALAGGLLIGITAPLIGVFLVLRRLSMIGDTLAHVTIAGVALGFLTGFYPLGAGLVFAVAASFAIEKLRKAYKSYAELSIAIIMSGGVALASLFFTLGKGYNADVMGYLFGSIYTLNSADLIVVGIVTVLVVAVIILFFKEFFLLSFEEDAASVSGLPVRMLNLLLTVMTALVISTAIKIVGSLLVSALLTIPVAISLLLARSFKKTVVLAVVVAEIAVIGGLVVAGVWNLAPGATIVLLLIALLIVTLIGKKGVS